MSKILPRVSIVTVNLNNASGLVNTIESVAAQSFRDYEFIVIDGGSTDGSVDVVTSHGDVISHWVSEPDAGIYPAMNKGLLMACGEYVHFLNSGDWFCSPMVLAEVFSDNKYNEDLLYGDFIQKNQKNDIQLFKQPEELTVGLFFREGLCHQTVFFKRELFESFGTYNENMKLSADWEFIIRVLLAGRSSRHLPFAVVQYAGMGISITQADCSLREKAAILKHLLPDVVYRDYIVLQSLKRECYRLKQYENWAVRIRDRNVLVNYAMATYWFWLKIRRFLFHRKEDRKFF